jgi:hypothetical protein
MLLSFSRETSTGIISNVQLSSIAGGVRSLSGPASEGVMNAISRKKLEMGARALEWSLAHPDPSQGYAEAVSRLENRLKRGEQLASQQRDGILEVRRATARKKDLRRQLKDVHLAHLIRVAQVASEEEPELAEKFAMPGRVTTYGAFRTAARGLAAEAEGRKELLVKHGMSEALLQDLTKLLEEFDEVTERGAQARAAHVGASIELDNVASEVVQIVKLMDTRNRFRFARDGELLSAWRQASNVVGSRRAPPPETQPGPTPPAGGDVSPAA